MKYFGAKQPAEAYYVRFNFTRDLKESDVEAAVVTVLDITETPPVDVTDTLLDTRKQAISGKVVDVWGHGGTTGHNYQITCRITGTGGETYELEGILPVRET